MYIVKLQLFTLQIWTSSCFCFNRLHDFLDIWIPLCIQVAFTKLCRWKLWAPVIMEYHVYNIATRLCNKIFKMLYYFIKKMRLVLDVKKICKELLRKE